MNFFKSLVTLIAFLSLVLTSPYPVDANGYCQISDADYDNLELILKNDENAEKMIMSMLREHRLRQSDRMIKFMSSILRFHKYELFDFVAERINLEGDSKADFILPVTIFNGDFKRAQILLEERNFGPEMRDIKLSAYLLNAISSKKLDACDFLLSQNFDFFQLPHYPINYRGVSLEDWKHLISRHPERAAEISPKEFNFSSCWSAEQGLFMIELAYLCAEESKNTINPISFNPTAILKTVLICESYAEKRALIVYRLCELGADLTQKMFDDQTISIIDYLRDFGHSESYQAVINYQSKSNTAEI